MPVRVVRGRGAGQREERVRAVRAGGPHLGAGELPAAVDPLRPGAHAREVGARVGLAHPDAEVDLAARRCRAGAAGAAPRCRTASATGRSAGRRPSARPPARPAASSSSVTT